MDKNKRTMNEANGSATETHLRAETYPKQARSIRERARKSHVFFLTLYIFSFSVHFLIVNFRFYG